jgi:hypothetical protein
MLHARDLDAAPPAKGKAVTELEQIRSVLREYLALETEYKPIAEGWSHLQLRGAARRAWLKKARERLGELRKQLSMFADAEEIA